jgi:hypothetical protein
MKHQSLREHSRVNAHSDPAANAIRYTKRGALQMIAKVLARPLFFLRLHKGPPTDLFRIYIS